jgi:hypothetical protein
VELDAIVLRGLERNPEHRFGSAREMIDAIEACARPAAAAEVAQWLAANADTDDASPTRVRSPVALDPISPSTVAMTFARSIARAGRAPRAWSAAIAGVLLVVAGGVLAGPRIVGTRAASSKVGSAAPVTSAPLEDRPAPAPPPPATSGVAPEPPPPRWRPAARAPPPPRPRPAATATPRPCDVPFTTDENDIRRYRVECL